MILKINPICQTNSNTNFQSSNKVKKSVYNFASAIPISSSEGQAFKSYAISFGSNNLDRLNKPKINKIDVIKDNLTPYAEDILDKATNLAKAYNNKEITQSHVMYVTLIDILNYINALDSGEKTYKAEDVTNSQRLLQDEVNGPIFKDREMRKKIKPVIEEELGILEKYISELPKSNTKKTPVLAKNYINDLYSLFEAINSEDNGAGSLISEGDLFNASIYTNDINLEKNINKPFKQALKSSLFLGDFDNIDKVHVALYDEKSKNIWKNLNIGTNMVVLHDKSTSPKYIIKSLSETFRDKSNNFGQLNPQNTDVLVINKDSNIAFLMDTIDELKKDKKRNHVVLIEDLEKVILNAIPAEQLEQFATLPTFGLTKGSIDQMEDVPPNIKYIILTDKDYYYKSLSVGADMAAFFSNYCDVNIPIINTIQAIDLFKNEPRLTKKLKKKFTPAAIQKSIEAANQMPGNYPEKALKLMDLISAYYVDKNKEITPNDVQNYLKEAGDMFKSSDEDSSVKLVFDTGKRLRDIVGKESTKKEAQAIVKQIRSKKMGTKGMIIYSQDGSVGSGRRHTAQAIAGEAKIPYIEINTMDFGTKDVDLFGSGVQSPESSMKKLFSVVKSQAEENPDKSAVLFIENFEYFSIGELVSQYHQKAMAQLLREMENAEKQGLNILVIGSVADPRYIGEATMKSFKFIDNIEVSSPSINKNERFDILKYSIKKNKIKLAGSSEKEKEDIIKFVADITESFPFIYIQNIVKKAKTVAFERGHKSITKGDFTEAYLQITTGRPSTNEIKPYEKEIITSHECGHATNLEVMNLLAKNSGQPWHIPNKVNFVTLDPRGYYGGAVYDGKDENNEYSFEHNFADIVCCYGGHSCEKEFYKMDGSYGISQDLKQATNMADDMVKIMGQGPGTGKISLENNPNISANMKNVTECDMQVILRNALLVSDLITSTYADFNKQFVKKYSHLVGTGDCLVDGNTFREELNNWRNSQSKAKQEELNTLDRIITEVMETAKKGELY